MMKPLKKTTYHHGNLRQSIINAVALLIKENNSTSFKLKEVAEIVGTSQPAIYKHFRDKKQLLTEVAVYGYQLQSQYRDKSLQKAKNSPLEKIKAIGISYIDFAKSHTGYFLLIKNLETKEILSSKRYLIERKRTVNMILTTVKHCIDEGFFIKTNVMTAMTMLSAGALGLAHMYITKQIEFTSAQLLDENKNKDEDGFFEKIFELHINSLLSKKGKKEFLSIK